MKTFARHSLAASLVGAALLWLPGCGTMERTRNAVDTTRGYLEWSLEHRQLVRVRPWERDLLAREDMGWQPDKMQSLRESHIRFSKEASLGGGSAGGGGCGCN